MASIIKQIQSAVEAKIESMLPAGVKVMSRLRGDISNNIAANIAAKNICVLVFPPAIGGIKANVLRSTMADDCVIQIRIIESPKLNSSGTDAYEIVEALLSLNGFKTQNDVSLFIKSVESADPDNVNVVEFVIELTFAVNFPRIAI